MSEMAEQGNMVSVLMSAYNTPNFYLEQSIGSILKQTYREIELIIVIDSPENKEMVHFIEEIAQKDDRIKILYNERNIGLTNSLNKALITAKGTYIARMDTDDIAFPNRIERQLLFLQEGNYDLVASKVIKIDESGAPIADVDKTTWNEKKIKTMLRVMNVIPHPTWLGKREVFAQLNGYRNIDTCEDYDFLLRARSIGFRIGMCNEPYLQYRVNPNGISATNRRRQVLTTCYLSKNWRHVSSVEGGLDRYLANYLSTESETREEKIVYYWQAIKVKLLASILGVSV